MLTLKPLRERRRNRLKEIEGLFGNGYSLFKFKSKDPNFDPNSPTFRKPAPQKDLYFPDGTKVPTIRDVPKLPTAKEVQARFNKQTPIRPKGYFRMYCSAPAFKHPQKPPPQRTPLLLKNRLKNLHGETSKYFTPQNLQRPQPLHELAKKIQSKKTNPEMSKSVKLKPAQSPWVTRRRSQREFDQSDVGAWSVHKLLDKHVPCTGGVEDLRGRHNASYDDDDKDTSYGDGDFGNGHHQQVEAFNWMMKDNSADEDTRSGSSKFVTAPQPFLREEPTRVFGDFDRNSTRWDRNSGGFGGNNSSFDRNNDSLDHHSGSYDRNIGSFDRNNDSLDRHSRSSDRNIGSFDHNNGSFDRNSTGFDHNSTGFDRKNGNLDSNNTRLNLPTLPEYFDGMGTLQNGKISSSLLEPNALDFDGNKQSYPLRPKKELAPIDNIFLQKTVSSSSASPQYSRTGCLCSSCKSNSSVTTPPPFTVRELIHMNKLKEESSSNAPDHSSNFNPSKSKTSGFRNSQDKCNNWFNKGTIIGTNSGGNKWASTGDSIGTNSGGNKWAVSNNGDVNNNHMVQTGYQPTVKPVRNLFKSSSTVTSYDGSYVYNFPSMANGGFGNNLDSPRFCNDLKPTSPGTPDLFSYNSNSENNKLPPRQDHFSYNDNNNNDDLPPQFTPPELVIHDPYGRVSSPDVHEKSKSSSGIGGISSHTSTMSSTNWPNDDPMQAFGTQHFNHLETNPFEQFEDDARTVDTNFSFDSPTGSLKTHSYDFQENNEGDWGFGDTDDDLFGNL